MSERPPAWNHVTQDLSGKTVVISGGTTGIGRATAKLLAAKGASVLIFGRHQAELDEALEDIGRVGDVGGITADQTKEEEVQNVFSAADERFGGVDILINNASVAARSVEQGAFRSWEYVLDTNLLGYMACARAAIDRMTAKDGGHIVNIGSLAAEENGKGYDVYVATKAAVRAWSDALREEIQNENVKVTLIEPSLVDTGMPHSVPADQRVEEEIQEKLEAEDVAECIYYCLIQPPRCDLTTIQLQPHRSPVLRTV